MSQRQDRNKVSDGTLDEKRRSLFLERRLYSSRAFCIASQAAFGNVIWQKVEGERRRSSLLRLRRSSRRLGQFEPPFGLSNDGSFEALLPFLTKAPSCTTCSVLYPSSVEAPEVDRASRTSRHHEAAMEPDTEVVWSSPTDDFVSALLLLPGSSIVGDLLGDRRVHLVLRSRCCNRPR